MTPTIDCDDLENSFRKDPQYSSSSHILDLLKQFRMWRMGPGGSQVVDFTAEMAQQKLETMTRGMQVKQLSDFWDSRILWRYFFIRKKAINGRAQQRGNTFVQRNFS